MAESFNAITTAGTGAAYTAVVDGVTSLTTGISFVMVPHVVSTTTLPTLDVNSLGGKYIKRPVSGSPSLTVAGDETDWLPADKPVRVTYNGLYWVVDDPKPSMNDLYGTTPIERGGTGATTAAGALTNLGLTATVEELNIMTNVIVTAEELNCCDGVTENIQAQLDDKAAVDHYHAASEITSGTISTDRLPTTSIEKGGTGATNAAAALMNLGLTATADELNHCDGVTKNIQTQLDGKAASSHNHAASAITSGTLSSSRLPTIPITKGGTGATTAAAALTALGAAPAGYGLGKVSYTDSNTFYTTQTALDNLTVNGFWAYVNASTPLSALDSYTKYVFGITYAYGVDYITQVGYCVDRETKIVRHKINGLWGQWLFENPPMIAGVEYPTTELSAGSIVYRKRITYTNPAAFGTTGTLTELLIPHDIENFGTAVSADGKIGTLILMPYISDTGTVTDVSKVDGENIIVRTTAGWVANTYWRVDLAYTKIE